MSDLETLRAMLTRAGVTFQEEPMEPPGGKFGDVQLVVYSREGPNNTGARDCTANFYFDAEGKLLAVGAWS